MRTNTNDGAHLTPEMALAVGMYRLANGTSYQVCAEAFNICNPTAIKASRDTITTITNE